MQYKSWGVSHDPSITHSNDLDCPNCHWSHPGSNIRVSNLIPYIVGFDIQVGRNQKFPGGFIIECPECFEKFWFHAAAASIDLLKLKGAWPE